MSDALIQVEGESSAKAVESAAVVSRSPMQLAMRRLRKDWLTMTALVVALLFIIAGIAAPILKAMGILDPFTTNQDLLDVYTLPIGSWSGASGDHWLGVEPGVGRDTLSRVLYGLSFSLGIAITATLLAVIIGVVMGIIAGVAGGWVDSIIGRLIDLTLAFPQTLLLLAFSTTGLVIVQNAGISNPLWAQFTYVILILAVFGWTGVARLVRGQVLSLREREFVHAARLIGASPGRIYFREILPNIWAPILVQFTLILPAYISAEAALGYLGVSVKPPTPTLGNVLNDGLRYADSEFLYFFVPALMIATLVVAFNLLGDGLRDALDPKSDR